MSWVDTPFSTIEEAHQVAKTMEMQPSSITVQGEYRVFTVLTYRAGRRKSSLLTCAQHISGGAVKQRLVSNCARRPVDPDAPRWGEHERLGAGPWVSTQHGSLTGAAAHRRRNVTNFEPPVRSGTLVVFAEPKGEFIEYLDTGEGTVLARSLRPMYAPTTNKEAT